MMKPEFSKPFDLAAARAGAPIGCANGWQPEVLKFAENGLFGTMTKPSGEEFPASWTRSGESDSGVISKDKDLVMLPLGLIDGKPVFVGDEVEYETFVGWGRDSVSAEWREFGKCRWPAPAKVYPTYTGDLDALRHEYNRCMGSTVNGAMERVANAALRHALDAGQVALPARPEEARCARDMRVAKAVLAEFTDAVRDGVPLHVIDLPTIIEKIK